MAKARTTRDDWINEALRVIEQDGVEAVRVESIARRLKVTKGGFYYNFDGRDELLESALLAWEDRAVEQVIDTVERESDPLARLERLFDIASWDRRVLRVDAAIAAASLSGDPQVRAVYDRIHKRRFDYVTSIYLELGFSGPDAQHWARCAYSMWLGTAQLIALDPGIFRLDEHLERHRNHIRSIVVPPDRPPPPRPSPR